MDISMVIIMIILVMVYIVPIVAFIILIMWMLNRVNQPGRVWVGWVILVSVFILITSASFFMAKYGGTTGTSPQPYSVDIEGEGINKANIDVALDIHNKKVYGFGSLRIEYDNGNRYIPLTFDEEGNLIGQEEALPYATEIQHALKHNGPSITLTGHSISYSEMEQITETKLTKKTDTLNKDIFVFNLLRFQFITVFLLGYYLVKLKKKRDKERRNTDVIKIQDL